MIANILTTKKAANLYKISCLTEFQKLIILPAYEAVPQLSSVPFSLASYAFFAP
jgi:hypothetical protein